MPCPQPLLLPRSGYSAALCLTPLLAAPPGAIPILLHHVLAFLSPTDVVRVLSCLSSSQTGTAPVVDLFTTRVSVLDIPPLSPNGNTGSRNPFLASEQVSLVFTYQVYV